MQIIRVPVGAFITNCYIAEGQEPGRGFLVDPADNPKKLISILEEKQICPEAILLTHVTYKRSEIEKRLTEAGVPASEVLPFIEAYTSEHANSTETTTLVDQEKIGQMRFYNNPIRFNDELCPIWRGAPLLGEDSREILAGLGYSEEKIDQLFADGVVGSSMI